MRFEIKMRSEDLRLADIEFAHAGAQGAALHAHNFGRNAATGLFGQRQEILVIGKMDGGLGHYLPSRFADLFAPRRNDHGAADLLFDAFADDIGSAVKRSGDSGKVHARL